MRDNIYFIRLKNTSSSPEVYMGDFIYHIHCIFLTCFLQVIMFVLFEFYHRSSSTQITSAEVQLFIEEEIDYLCTNEKKSISTVNDYVGKLHSSNGNVRTMFYLQSNKDVRFLTFLTYFLDLYFIFHIVFSKCIPTFDILKGYGRGEYNYIICSIFKTKWKEVRFYKTKCFDIM